MHHKRKMKAFEAFKKRNTQDLMKQTQRTNFAKNRNFAHEEHGVFLKLSLEALSHSESQASSFLE